MIDYKTIRNTLVGGLYNYTGNLTILAEQSEKKPNTPYLSLKFTSLLANDSMNPNEYTSNVQDGVEIREVTNPEISVSITSYGTDDDESVDLALNAYSWLKTAGYYELEGKDIIVVSMDPIQNRDTILGDVTYERKQGFDVRLRVKGEVSYTVEDIDNVELNQEWIK